MQPGDSEPNAVTAAYTNRAAEYTDLLGTVDAMHPADQHLITSWAEGVTGAVIDAGCGPGHWTDHLAQRGTDIRGIDLVPEFVTHASRTYPSTRFDIGSVDELDIPTASLGGVLAWYSLIHHAPETIDTPLAEFARVLRPGGALLLGCFEGPAVEAFDHAVVTAYRWPMAELGARLESADFEIVETHTRTGDGHRPHGAILARRR